MDRIIQYRESIKTLLSQYNSVQKQSDDYESQLIFDEIRDHYLWLDVGWDDYKRIYHTIIHFDIKDGKIWLQENATDLNPAEDLIDLGISRDNIVLGLQPPYKRPHTNYGVA